MRRHARSRAAGELGGDGVAVLVQVPVGDVEGGAIVLVESDRGDIPGDLTLASPEPGQAAARAAKSLSASLEQLEPVLRTVKDKLVASSPEHLTVEFGVKLGGETGIILAKGTAEVNLKITMTWDREPRQVGDASGRV
jgi:NTP-dependent ternary system trypsin peptidase co-occuring protein